LSDNYHKPHDKRHKEALKNKKVFLSLLKDCINEPWTNEIDEDSLRLSNKSFILQDFSEKEADVVYEAEIKGVKMIFYILLEIQSFVDYRMPYRLLLYITEILRDYYNNADVKQRKRKDFKFPVVIPMVYYCGSRRWTVPLNIKEMFSAPAIFGNYVMDLEYILVQSNSFDENKLKSLSSRLLALIMLLEQSKNGAEFINNLLHHKADITKFDSEEERIFYLFVKIIAKAYGYNEIETIKKMIHETNTQEADSMLCDVVANAERKREKELAQREEIGMKKGVMQKEAEIAKALNISPNKLNEFIASGKLAKLVETLD